MTMNLLEGMMEPCIMMDKTSASDGGGGFRLVWVEGATFQAFVRKDTASAIVVAEQQGVNEIFTVVVPKGTPLEYHDVFQRVSDGAVFRMTSSSMIDAPAVSSVQIAKGKCERWELT